VKSTYDPCRTSSYIPFTQELGSNQRPYVSWVLSLLSIAAWLLNPWIFFGLRSKVASIRNSYHNCELNPFSRKHCLLDDW
jgi:hypothetical protein